MAKRRIRVLVADTSATMRQLFTTMLNSDLAIEVVGIAQDPKIVCNKVERLIPDVVLLDADMMRMEEIQFLEKLMRLQPVPLIMVGSLDQGSCEVTMKALELGAVDFIVKPDTNSSVSIDEISKDLISKIKAAMMAKVIVAPQKSIPPEPVRPTAKLSHQIIAIGASTGGTEAIRTVLMGMPAGSPGIVIVQHMPPGFTKSFAERLNAHCSIKVKEARDGDLIVPGQALLAPGGLHMAVNKAGSQLSVRVYDSEPVSLHRPSVDVLFESCAKQLGSKATGVILTGMGNDGARGLKKMRDTGSHTFAQDEATCVVFGMPKEAIASGGVETVLPLNQIAAAIA